MNMASNDNISIPEVEEVFEALTALELSQNINDADDLFDIPRRHGNTAVCNVTPSPFSTPKRYEKLSTRDNRNVDGALSISDGVISPFTTFRLKPISERIRGTNLSIKESGIVSLELFKPRNNTESLVETFTVSQDGKQISLTRFRHSTEVTNDMPRSDHTRQKTYLLDNLPKKLHKKYEYCRRFVNLVKSKTPKIIMYNQQAKCMLMENFPDPNFMAKFYNGQTFLSTWKGMKLVNEEQGSILSISSSRIQQFTTEIQQLIKFAKKCHRQCQEIESLVKSSTTNCHEVEEVFPIIMGSRKSLSERNERLPTPSMCVADVLNTSGSSCSSENNTSCLEDISIVRQTTIPNLGHATLLSSGEVRVEYKDGCHIKTNQTDDIFTFIDKNGVCKQYNRHRILPNEVKAKFTFIPMVLDHLNLESESNQTRRSSQ